MGEPTFADSARLSYQIRTMRQLGFCPEPDMMYAWEVKAQEMEDALAVPEGLSEAGARAIAEACNTPEDAPPKALRYLIARKFGVEMEDVSAAQAQAFAAIIKACGGKVPGEYTVTVSFDPDKVACLLEQLRQDLCEGLAEAVVCTPEPTEH